MIPTGKAALKAALGSTYPTSRGSDNSFGPGSSTSRSGGSGGIRKLARHVRVNTATRAPAKATALADAKSPKKQGSSSSVGGPPCYTVGPKGITRHSIKVTSLNGKQLKQFASATLARQFLGLTNGTFYKRLHDGAPTENGWFITSNTDPIPAVAFNDGGMDFKATPAKVIAKTKKPASPPPPPPSPAAAAAAAAAATATTSKVRQQPPVARVRKPPPPAARIIRAHSGQLRWGSGGSGRGFSGGNAGRGVRSQPSTEQNRGHSKQGSLGGASRGGRGSGSSAIKKSSKPPPPPPSASVLKKKPLLRPNRSHATTVRKQKVPMPSEVADCSVLYCTVKGCTSKQRARGRCVKHGVNGLCKKKRCLKPVHSHGLCYQHNQEK